MAPFPPLFFLSFLSFLFFLWGKRERERVGGESQLAARVQKDMYCGGGGKLKKKGGVVWTPEAKRAWVPRACSSYCAYPFGS